MYVNQPGLLSIRLLVMLQKTQKLDRHVFSSAWGLVPLPPALFKGQLYYHSGLSSHDEPKQVWKFRTVKSKKKFSSKTLLFTVILKGYECF